MSLYGYLFRSQLLWRIPRATTISDINASLKTKYPSRVGIKIAQDGRFDKIFKTGDSHEGRIQLTWRRTSLGVWLRVLTRRLIVIGPTSAGQKNFQSHELRRRLKHRIEL